MSPKGSLAPTHFPQVSIDEAYLTFQLDCQSRRMRPATLGWYRWTLLPFLQWAKKEHSLTYLVQIGSVHIRAYLVEKQTVDKGERTERTASLHHTYNIARCLRAFFNFCVNEGWLEESPMQRLRMPKKPKKVLAAYTTNEIKRLLAAAQDDRERSLLYFLLDTGVRASELTSIQARDIDIENRKVIIRDGKGGKERTVYFGVKTARFLIRHMRGMEDWRYVWWNQHTGLKLGYRGLARTLQLIGDRVNIRCTAHKFRRTFAINSLRQGMNIYLLARIMGHEDIATLRYYLDIVEADSQMGQDQFGVVDNL